MIRLENLKNNSHVFVEHVNIKKKEKEIASFIPEDIESSSDDNDDDDDDDDDESHCCHILSFTVYTTNLHKWRC